MTKYNCTLKTSCFDLERTLDCGQAFRWRKQKDGSWFGVVMDRPLFIKQEGALLYLSCDPLDAPFWENYFSLDRDYGEMEALLALDPRTAPALSCSSGIRILRQDPWEALISFILSANNNVKRIMGIIERVCSVFGEPDEFQGKAYHKFPKPEVLAASSPEQLKDCGAGYRAPYIVETSKRIAEGYDLPALRTMEFADAKKKLLTFKGVGPKVAECIMLFSMDFDQAFPVDVWVKRISAYLYPGEDGKKAAKAAAERFGVWAGAAQQYLFHYARTMGLKEIDA